MTKSFQHKWLCSAVRLIGLSLYASPAFAYRTVADDPSVTGMSIHGWETSQITFQLLQNSDNDHDAASTLAAVQQAASVWSGVGCQHPTFGVESAASTGHALPGDGQNTIEWTGSFESRGIPDDGGAYADVQLVSSGGPFSIAEVDIYLNRDALTCTASDCKETYRVVLHELGHALGLAHPCELSASGGVPSCSDVPGAEDAVMYPVLTGATIPAGDDVAGICAFYASTNDREDDARPNHSTSGDSKTVTPSLQLGDPCNASTSCVTAVCSSENTCVSACSSDKECLVDQTCAAGKCAGGAQLGAQCSQAIDCVTRVCATGTEVGSFCTRSCSGSVPCPENWQCATVQGQDVCTPKTAVGGGCSIGVLAPHRPYWQAVAALGLLFTLRRRKVGRRGGKTSVTMVAQPGQRGTP